MIAPPSGAWLLPPLQAGGAHQLVLPHPGGAMDARQLVGSALGGAELLPGRTGGGWLEIEAGAWWLSVRQLQAILQDVEGAGFRVAGLRSSDRRTRVAAAALGLAAEGNGHTEQPLDAGLAASPQQEQNNGALQLHRGTLRSGDHLQSPGALLLLGDVNPGARISAAGHVLVWGRLRGSAHAGCQGDASARIVALQLRPLQLRIASAVARGPEGSPPEGLAEQASLVDGVIRIEPASPQWPLAGDWP